MNLFTKGVLTLTAVFTFSAAPAQAQVEWLLWKEAFELSPKPTPSETRPSLTPEQREQRLLALGIGGIATVFAHMAFQRIMRRRRTPEETTEVKRKNSKFSMLHKL